MSGLVMGALAWLAASETGPFSFGAFIAAGSVGAASHDIVMRIPVIAWSAANGKTKFLAANVCYIIIVIIFESLAHFKEAKGILRAGEVVGVKNAASASSNIIAKKIAERLESVPNMSRLAKDELGAIIDGIFSHAYDANDVKVSEKFFENALSAAERLDFWTPTKLWIVGMALQFISAQFGESVAEQCRAELAEMANNDFNLDVLETSKSELMSDIDALSAKYPPI